MVKRVAFVAALCEENTIRAPVSMIGVARNTIKLLLDLAAAVTRYQKRCCATWPAGAFGATRFGRWSGGKDTNLSDGEAGSRPGLSVGRGPASTRTRS